MLLAKIASERNVGNRSESKGQAHLLGAFCEQYCGAWWPNVLIVRSVVKDCGEQQPAMLFRVVVCISVDVMRGCCSSRNWYVAAGPLRVEKQRAV